MKAEEGGGAGEGENSPLVEQEAGRGSGGGVRGGKKAGGRGGGGGGGLKKGPWTPAEDAILVEHVRRHGEGNWNAVQRHSDLARCGKSCRLRWANHLRPNLKKGSFSPEEEHLILRLHAQLGNKWARMAAQLPGRTDNEIKNYWNTRLKRRQRAGLPVYPPELQHAVRFDRHRQQQHHTSLGTTPPPLAADRRAPLPSLQRPPPLPTPVGFRPPTDITLPPLPANPFTCQLGFGFPLSPISPPSIQTSMFQQQQQQQIGVRNYDMNPSPLLSSPFTIKMELPSCQLYPEPSGGDALSSNGLLEALLQDTHVAEDMKTGELLALPAMADEQGVKWGQVFCGGDSGCENGGEGINYEAYQDYSDLDCDIGIKIKSEPPADASPAKDDVSALLNTPAPTMSILPDWYNPDKGEFSNGRPSVMTSDEGGLDVHQLASSFAIPSAEQDWNINSWPWNNMPGIC